MKWEIHLGTDIYEAIVTNIQDTVISLTLRRIDYSEDFEFPTSKAFGLMLLLDPIWAWDDTVSKAVLGMPIYNQVDEEDLVSVHWIIENAGGFVQSITIDRERNMPSVCHSPDDETDDRHVPEADYTIVVTHRAWATHLQTGMKWDSRAYDPSQVVEWQEPPRFPGDTIPVVSRDQEAGFVVAEKDQYTEHVPDALMLPRFSPKYYDADPVLSEDEITQDTLQTFLFQPVLLHVHDRVRLFPRSVGVLTSIRENALTIYQRTDIYRGTRGFSFGSIIFIGRARYRKLIRLLPR